jgi:hypothetical protein
MITTRMSPDWAPQMVYFSDNRTRENFTLSQGIGPWVAGDNDFRVKQFYITHEEEKAGKIVDNGVGGEWTRHLGPFHSASLRLEQHVFQGNKSSEASYAGSLRSLWTDGFETYAELGFTPFDTARALAAGVGERYAAGSAKFRLDGPWRTDVNARLSSLTDGNGRLTAQTKITSPIRYGSLFRVGTRFAINSTEFSSPNYYSPKTLALIQGVLSYEANVAPELQVTAEYRPGYGDESGAHSFIHELDATLEKRWGTDMRVLPSVRLAQTPTYEALSVGLSFAYRF